jgi:pulcherriminic acid synthase
MYRRGVVTPEQLHDRAFSLDPFPIWTQLRHEAPIFHDTKDRVYVVSRHPDVIEAFSDSERFTARLYRKTLGAVFGPNLLIWEGQHHVDQRKVVAPLFVPTRLDRYKELVEGVIDDLLAGVDPKGFDLVKDVSSLLPGKVIVRLLGLPPSDDERFHEWYETMMQGLWNDPVMRQRGREAHAALHKHIDPIVADRRANPRDDIMSRLIAAEVEELPSFISLLLTAGGETTDKAIGNMWTNLLANPQQLDAVRNDGTMLDRAFDETMRHSPSLVYLGREVLVDVDWHDVHIPQGAELRLAVGSANHDETVFERPDVFDIHRTDLHHGLEHRTAAYDDGAGHVAFGAGAHFCIGYALARMETVTVARLLLDRFGALEAVGDLPPLRVVGPSRFTTTLPVRRASA